MTETECDELCLQLERSTGPAHLRGKARFYLRELVGKPTAKFSNCTQDEFVSTVRQALYGNKWNELDTLMGGWW